MSRPRSRLPHPHDAHREDLRLAAAILVTGVLAGLVGRVCAAILHGVEHLLWHSLAAHHSSTATATLLEAARSTTPAHRFALVLGAGLLAAASWTLLSRRGGRPASVAAAMEGRPMPLLITAWHALTQILVVGAGASIGREVAPREMSAALAGTAADRLGLDPRDRRIIVAAAAGAGLAAVYSIPLSGAVFTLEVLLVALTPRTVASALGVSGIAVLVAHGSLRGAPFYTVPDLHSSASLTAWAVLAGPLLGWLGLQFRRAVHRCEAARPWSTRLLWTLPLGFLLVGAVAAVVPSVVGNGQASAQTLFDVRWDSPLSEAISVGGTPLDPWGALGVTAAGTGLAVAALTVAAKCVTTLVTIRSGAWGGVLTPGLALGAGVGAVTGLAWVALLEAVGLGGAVTAEQVAAHVFIGAAAFLGTSMKAPFTGLVLVLEFTHQGGDILVPSVIAVAGAVAATAWASRRSSRAED